VQYIIGLYPDFEEQKMTKEFLFKKVFPHKTYSDGSMRFLIYELNELISDFLIHQSLEENKQLKQSILMNAYLDKRLFQFFDYKKNNDLKKLETDDSSTNLYYKWSIENTLAEYITSKQIRTEEPNIQKSSDTLDEFFIVQKLKTYINALNYQSIFKKEYDIQFAKIIIDYVDQHPHSYLVSIYRSILTLIEDDTKTDIFYALKSAVLENKISIEDRKYLLVILKNYSIRKYNKGNTNFNVELFELYKYEMENLEDLYHNHLTPASYKNIISVAFTLREYNWAEAFIESNTKYLPKEHQNDNYYYNIARIQFQKKQYDASIQSLNNLNSKDVFLLLNAKVVLLKCFFENNDESVFESLILSVKILLKRKDFLVYHRVNYSNFLKYASKILKVKNRNDKKRLSVLKTELDGMKEVIDKDWLMCKV
jgi:hypothetical protein